MVTHLYWPFITIKPTLLEALADGKWTIVPYEVLVARGGACFIQIGKCQTGRVLVLETGQRCDLAEVARPWSFAADLTEISFFAPEVPKPEGQIAMNELFLGLMLFTEGVPHAPRWKEIISKLQTDKSFGARLYKDFVSKFIQTKPAAELQASLGRMLALNRSPIFYKLFEEYHEGLL